MESRKSRKTPNNSQTSQNSMRRTDTSWFNREAAEEEIQRVVWSNFGSQKSTDHAAFILLTATGHVRSRKTHAGREMPRIVAKELKNASPTRKKEIEVAPVVYVRINFLYY